MPAPLPLELRVRIVAAIVDEGSRIKDAAKRFMVGEATVKRLVWRMRRNGNLDPDPMGGDRHSLIQPSDREKLVALVEEKPDATLAELVAMYEEQYGVKLSSSAMSRTLRRESLTLKKRPSSPRSTTRPGSLIAGTHSRTSSGP